MTPEGDVTQLSSFGGSNAIRPSQTSLVEGIDGSFYGVVYSLGPGGPFPPHPSGAIVRVQRDGVSTFFANFAGTGAARPVSLTAASDGNLYGTTSDGDSERGGSVFRVSSDGSITIFGRLPTGYNGYGVLTEAVDGNLYGVFAMSAGGPNQIFKVTRSGEISVFHTYNAAVEGTGATPLVAAPDGNFYGGTSSGGPNNVGTIYKLSLSAVVTILNPQGDGMRLILAGSGNFYGVTHRPRGRGLPADTLVYRATATGVTTLLRTLEGWDEAAFAAGPADDLYLARPEGLGPGEGAIERLRSDAESSTIYRFNSSSAEYPSSSLIEGPDGNFYGTLLTGGAGSGGILRVTPTGERETIASFTGANGRFPSTPLVLGPDRRLYGTTESGGEQGNGVIFSSSLSGDLHAIVSFSGPDGRAPKTPLLLAGDGMLYGTTASGGRANLGTIFRVSPAGGIQTVASFDGHNGAFPLTRLVEGSNGSFYGMAAGYSTFVSNAAAAVYEVKPDGNVTNLHAFDGVSSGARLSELTKASDGELYGIAPPIGSTSDLTVFKLTLDGVFTEVATIEERQPDLPSPSFTLATDGHLYAAIPADYYAEHQGGRIVRLSTNGIMSTVATFDSSDGTPNTSLLQASDGYFYGATVFGTRRAVGGTIYRARLLAPTMESVSPHHAPAGTEVVITGAALTGATRVTFQGVVASFTVNSDTKITAKVPNGAVGTAVSVTSPKGVATFPAGSVPPARALNISTRATIGTGDQAMIGGVIVDRGGPKKVLVRALGPSLAAAGVSAALADPLLQLYDGNGAVIADNDDWMDSPDRQAIADTNIAPADRHESAAIAELQAGNYTAVVKGAGETTGVGLVEVYDLAPATGRLANIATRADIGGGDKVMIGGFIFGGDAPAKILVRGIGPSLSRGVPPIVGALSDPVLDLRDSDGNLIATNDNWQEGVQRQQIESTGIPPSDPSESAIVATLDPGSYTAVVRGVNGTSGVGLVEIYGLD